MAEVTKFIAGSLQALSAMVQLELPHLNVLTKVDLLNPDSKVSFAFNICCAARRRHVVGEEVMSSEVCNDYQCEYLSAILEMMSHWLMMG